MGGRRWCSGESVKTATGSSSRSSGDPRGLTWAPSPHQRLSLSCYSSDKADWDIAAPHLHPKRSGRWGMKTRSREDPTWSREKTRRSQSHPYSCPEVGKGCPEQSPTGKGSQQGPWLQIELQSKAERANQQEVDSSIRNDPSWPRPLVGAAESSGSSTVQSVSQDHVLINLPSTPYSGWDAWREVAGRSGQAAPHTHTPSAPLLQSLFLTGWAPSKRGAGWGCKVTGTGVLTVILIRANPPNPTSSLPPSITTRCFTTKRNK